MNLDIQARPNVINLFFQSKIQISILVVFEKKNYTYIFKDLAKYLDAIHPKNQLKFNYFNLNKYKFNE